MPARELVLEQRGTKLLEAHGYIVLKLGNTGFPDRMVCWRGKHIWIEWKAEGGDLTPAQKRRIPKLRAMGEEVLVTSSPSEALLCAGLWLK